MNLLVKLPNFHCDIQYIQKSIDVYILFEKYEFAKTSYLTINIILCIVLQAYHTVCEWAQRRLHYISLTQF